MKTCKICKQEKPLEDFHLNKGCKDGRETRCKSCRKEVAASKYKENPFKTMIRSKRSECKKKGLEFNLTEEYLKKLWTGVCPVFNVPITIGNSGMGSHMSGHLDRLDPDKGYIKGNVMFITGRANRIKYNATIEELQLIVDYMKRQERATTIPKGSTPEAIAGGSGEHLEEG